MPKKSRIHFPNAIYHVMIRGNNRQKIFHNNIHYEQFLLFLRESIERFTYKLHAYCLMPNHVHLIVEIKNIPLAKIMQNINYRYSRWFNRKLNRIGHLFQGRYKAISIQEEKYILSLCRYIHMNPVESKLVKSSKQYRWSSHQIYLGSEKIPWVTIDFILKLLSHCKTTKKLTYKEFMQNGIKNYKFIPALSISPDGKLHINDCVLKKISQFFHANTIPKLNLDIIFDTVCTTLGVDKQELSLPNKCWKLARARAAIVIYAQEYCQVSIRNLASILRRSPQAIINTANNLKKRAAKNPDENKELFDIAVKLQNYYKKTNQKELNN